MRHRRLKLVIHIENWWMYRMYRNQLLLLIHLFIFSFFFLSNFQIFSSHFSQELWGLEDWNLHVVHTWTVGRCIVYTGIRLLLHICPFISSFFFLSNFLTLKFFVTLFSGITRPRRLKPGTYVDSGQMYRVYRNQAAAAYLSLNFSFFFLSNFRTWKFFLTLSSAELWDPDDWNMVHAWKMSGCIVYIAIILLLFFLPLFFHFSFFPIFKH